MIIPRSAKKINPYFQKIGVDLEKFIFYSQQPVQSAKIDSSRIIDALYLKSPNKSI